MRDDDAKIETGRDITATLDAFQQSLHTMLGSLSRSMTPEEIAAARQSLEMAEARITKLKIRFPERR
jgi:cob(I)alamin adenosyltransferase